MSTRDIRFTVGDHEYFVIQWPARKALKMKAKLVKILGPSFVEMAQAGTAKDEGDQVLAMGKAVEKLFENATEDEVVDLLVEVVECASRDKERLVNKFDDVYTGNLKEAYIAFFHIIKENFADFLEGFKLDALFSKASK